MSSLDAVNRQILQALHADPRMSMSALGREVGLSAPSVTERVQRMQQDGVIAGFRMVVDPAALGLPVAAFVRLRPAPGQLSRLAELADSIDQVSECHRITGEDCFLVHGQTISSIVVTSPVPPRPLPVPD